MGKNIFTIGLILTAVLMFGITSIILAGPPKQAPDVEVAMKEEVTITTTVSSRISYQGYLTDKNTGNPLNGQYNMVFQFWDAATNGSQVGSDITVSNVTVEKGLFNVEIDVPQDTFNGQGIWIQVKVGNEWLDPRKEILPVPYALSLRPGAYISGTRPTDNSIIGVTNKGEGNGLYGKTQANTNYASAGVWGQSVYTNTFGVLGESEYGIGVEGRNLNPNNPRSAVVGYNIGGGKGVYGESANDYGVYGKSHTSYGVYGETDGDTAWTDAGVRGYSTYTSTFGVLGESEYGIGVEGRITNTTNTSTAVFGYNTGGGDGVGGYSATSHGVYGVTGGNNAFSDAGVYGYSTYTDTLGVLGKSEYGNGVMGIITNSNNSNSATVGWNQGGGIGVAGYSDNNYGVYGDGATYGVVAPDGMLAPTFDVGNPDLAEFVPTDGGDLEAGDVVVISQKPNGEFGVRKASQAYDTAAAGIISTAPGVTLGVRDGVIIDGNNGGDVPLALAGRVPCKVDASFGAIAIGDLLTTSSTPGYAMRCDNPTNCIGSIVGKALEPLEEGTGVILVLVTLQ